MDPRHSKETEPTTGSAIPHFYFPFFFPFACERSDPATDFSSLVDPLLLNSLDAFGATFLLVVMEASFSCLSTTRPQVPDSQRRQGAIQGFQQQPDSVAGPVRRFASQGFGYGMKELTARLVSITSSRPANPSSGCKRTIMAAVPVILPFSTTALPVLEFGF